VPVMVMALTGKDLPPSTRIWMLRRLPIHAPPSLLDGVRSLLVPGADLSVLLLVTQEMHVRQDRAAMVRYSRLLADARPGARAVAAAYLLRMGHTRRAAELAAALALGPGGPELRQVEVLLATLPRVPPPVLEAVTQRLGVERRPSLKIQAIRFLARFRHTKARPVLHRLLDDRIPAVRKAAFDAIVTLASPLTEDTLRPVLADEDVDRRLWAADALRRRDDVEGLPVVIMALQKGTDAQRVAAARILGGFRTDGAVEPLLDAMEDDQPGVRAAALRSAQAVLASLFPQRRLVLTTTGYAADAPPEVRREAVDRIRRWWETYRNADW
ncbi:MAG: HEAT repeat domain-containing protein, partial [Planctomycetota bacterium]